MEAAVAPPPAGGPHQSKGACHQHRLEPSDSPASPAGTQSHPVRHLPSRPPQPQALGTLQAHGPPGASRKFLNLPPSSHLGGPLLKPFPLPGVPSPSLFTWLTPTHPAASAPASPPCRSPLGSLPHREGPLACSFPGAWRHCCGWQAPSPGANLCGRFRERCAPPHMWPTRGRRARPTSRRDAVYRGSAGIPGSSGLPARLPGWVRASSPLCGTEGDNPSKLPLPKCQGETGTWPAGLPRSGQGPTLDESYVCQALQRGPTPPFYKKMGGPGSKAGGY